jgi:hypothetical protein
MKSAILAAGLMWAASVAADRLPPGLAAKLDPPPVIVLNRLSKADRTKASGDGAMIAGAHRKLPDDAMKGGRWTQLPAGESVWRLALKSPGANGIRVHFNHRNLASLVARCWSANIVKGTLQSQRTLLLLQDTRRDSVKEKRITHSKPLALHFVEVI